MFTPFTTAGNLISCSSDRFFAFVGKGFFFVDNRENPEGGLEGIDQAINLGINRGYFPKTAIGHELVHKLRSGRYRYKGILICT